MKEQKYSITFVYMRAILSILFSVLLATASAQTEPIADKVNPELKRFVYQTNTSINKRVFDSIYFDVNYEKGNKWVFKFTYRAKDYEMVADDEFTETLEFEIDPPKGNSFVLTGEDFKKAKVIYSRSCFCPDTGPRQLESGIIRAKKTGKNTWFITFDLSICPRPGRTGDSYRKTLRGYFHPGSLEF